MTFFIFYYHLIFDSKSLKIYGFKTLIRIVEEDGTIHPAKDFIYILEKHPYIHILEEKIIKEVMEKSKKWDILIAINLSETGFLTGKFIEKNFLK